MLGYLAIDHPTHVDVLDLKGATGGLHANQHPAIDRKARRAPVRAAVNAPENDPLASAPSTGTPNLVSVGGKWYEMDKAP